MKAPSKETPLYPMLFGGGQERNFRPGTENTGMIAGLGEAAQLVVDNLETYSSHMRKVLCSCLVVSYNYTFCPLSFVKQEYESHKSRTVYFSYVL